MAYAIELLFDKETEAAVQEVWEAVANATDSSFLLDIGARPHVSLAVYEEADLASTLEAFGARSLPVQLASAGAFPGKEGAVFLAPVVTPDLLDLHRRWHEEAPGSAPLYAPGAWVPHATVGILLPDDAVKEALAVARAGLPLQGCFESAVLIEFEMGGKRPVQYVAEIALK